MYVCINFISQTIEYIVLSQFEKYLGWLADSVPTKEVQKFSSSPGIVTGFEFLNVHPVRLGAISSGENVLISFLEYFVGKNNSFFWFYAQPTAFILWCKKAGHNIVKNLGLFFSFLEKLFKFSFLHLFCTCFLWMGFIA